jgi:hypothetical protein
VNVLFKFVERRRLAETSLYDLFIFATEKDYRRYIDLYKDIIIFCKRRERRFFKTYRSRGELFVKTVDNLIILLKLKPEEKRSNSLKYKDFQYFFCLICHDLALKNK